MGSNLQAGVADAGREREPKNWQWIPLSAYVFVVLALVAMVVAPALMLRRVTELSRTVTATILPTMDALRDFAFAMERRGAASRDRFLTGDPIHEQRFRDATAAEAAALDRLEVLIPRLGPRAVEHLDSLRSYQARLDSIEFRLLANGADVATYVEALPAVESLRAGMATEIEGLRIILGDVSQERLADQSRWTDPHVILTIILAIVALISAATVGWFATAQARLRQQLQAALAESDRRRQALERVSESRNRLMRGFSHDLKNPLGAALGYLSLLRDGMMGSLDEKQQRSVERAGKSVGEAIHLVEDLLEIARAESGRLEVKIAPTDLSAVVRETAEEYRGQAESKGLRFDVEVPESMEPVPTDGHRVEQVLGNLISNAIKYTGEGKVSVRLDLEEGTAAWNGRPLVAISVTDTGPGIPAEKLPILFDEFVRLETATGSSGLGIGLTISKRVAEALGGTLEVESRVGQGSTFTLRLPSTSPLLKKPAPRTTALPSNPERIV